MIERLREAYYDGTLETTVAAILIESGCTLLMVGRRAKGGWCYGLTCVPELEPVEVSAAQIQSDRVQIAVGPTSTAECLHFKTEGDATYIRDWLLKQRTANVASA